MPKNTRSTTHSTFRTILPWLCIVAGLLILGATLSFASWKASHQPPKLASREDVFKLKEVVTDIKTKLEDANGTWQDMSSCTIIEPRSFGDETRYYCEVQYRHVTTIAGDGQIRDLINRQVDLLQEAGYVVTDIRYPKFAINANDTFRVNQAGSAVIRTDKLESLKQNCALGYTLENVTDNSAKFIQQIRCYIDADDTYLQKVDRV